MKFVDIGSAKIDVDRVNRKGYSEVVYGSSKSAEQIEKIINVLLDKKENALVTRVNIEKYDYLRERIPGLSYDKESQVLTVGSSNPKLKFGLLYVVCAGTSDLAIAKEAVEVAKWMGINVKYLWDVGVAGLDRLLYYKEELRKADVIVAVAGMEGSLPTVLSGLVDAPVIAVPTSIGYGANLKGITTMLSMLTSCSSGITVTNIDNGFGAAYQAGLMIRRMNRMVMKND
ncbi:nickel pincer cofactor biosynthesis protein LarB [Ligilactobacillus acidipiscis]|uniref:nickel pincer cofactor biosynthesis protein LarB n=1 Tax=Ligilactobacillus acidipiscis TaxID=89059 RepID=UPI0023F7810F|nr:nickel pincer cofactor biosynthesis protein LarB [Ligilactobacillus acidipiscis]WEV57520.1 nickel pincer cofactor biosynthesis protein LarB [Ligilactobacillus acidipiscis]